MDGDLPAGADGSRVEGHLPDVDGCLEAFLVKGSLEVVSLFPSCRGEPQLLRPFKVFGPRACNLQLHDPGFSGEGLPTAQAFCPRGFAPAARSHGCWVDQGSLIRFRLLDS